jgi:hypothetical protein
MRSAMRTTAAHNRRWKDAEALRKGRPRRRRKRLPKPLIESQHHVDCDCSACLPPTY